MTKTKFLEREVKIMRRLSVWHKFSTRKIGKLFDLSSAAISFHLKKTKADAAKKPTPQVTKRRDLMIKKLVKKQIVVTNKKGDVIRRIPQFGSASQLQKQLPAHLACSKSTVRNALVRSGCVARVRPRVPDTSEEDAGERLRFATAMLRKSKTFFERIGFSDEKLFTTNDASCRTQWVDAGEKPLPRENKRWARGRVLVWGYIDTHTRLLVIFPEQMKVKGETKLKPYRLTKPQYQRRCLQPNVPYSGKTQKGGQGACAGACAEAWPAFWGPAQGSVLCSRRFATPVAHWRKGQRAAGASRCWAEEGSSAVSQESGT